VTLYARASRRTRTITASFWRIVYRLRFLVVAEDRAICSIPGEREAAANDRSTPPNAYGARRTSARPSTGSHKKLRLVMAEERRNLVTTAAPELVYPRGSDCGRRRDYVLLGDAKMRRAENTGLLAQPRAPRQRREDRGRSYVMPDYRKKTRGRGNRISLRINSERTQNSTSMTRC